MNIIIIQDEILIEVPASTWGSGIADILKGRHTTIDAEIISEQTLPVDPAERRHEGVRMLADGSASVDRAIEPMRC